MEKAPLQREKSLAKKTKALYLQLALALLRLITDNTFKPEEHSSTLFSTADLCTVNQGL